MEPTTLVQALEVIARRAAEGQPFSSRDLAGAPALPSEEARMQCVRQLERLGLFLPADEPDEAPYLLRAGEQFLARHGDVEPAVLTFLPRTIDDLNAREALLGAGTTLVAAFREAVLSNDAAEYARASIVPPAFRPAVDTALALDLFAAAVALMARLSGEQPAGCVAEEVIAVQLIALAKGEIETALLLEDLSPDDAEAAMAAADDLFDLFDDDDVYFLFQMEEPADAAVAHDGEINADLGVVDQRLLSWFAPFSWAAPTGHLRYPT